MSLLFVYGLMGAGLALYVVTAGADLGAGVWDLLARGDKRLEERRLIGHAIAPIWEANHVWLIFVVVLLFSVFPFAFKRISIGLHIPISLALVGVVLRGAAFSFRAYGLHDAEGKRRWGRVFGFSSLLTPFFLGVSLGAVATGDLVNYEVGQSFADAFVFNWLSPFPVVVGLYTIVLFMLLAATYLAAESEGDISDRFRSRSVRCQILGAVMSAVVLVTSAGYAPTLFARLKESPTQWALQILVGGFAVATILFSRGGQVRWAQWTVGAQVAFVVLAFGHGMNGVLVQPDLDLEHAAGPVLGPIVPIVVVGTVLLVPALLFLYQLFKTQGD